jgi:quercetin dioxygenase-like cupin family protein
MTRRELSLLLPALAAAQTQSAKPLPSRAFRREDIEAKKSGTIVMQQMMNGPTHTGFHIDLHESELPAGEAPHAPHQHVHEEIVMVREGEIDVTIGEEKSRLGPGSAAYFASNQLHGWRNNGSVTAKYFVLALGDDK